MSGVTSILNRAIDVELIVYRTNSQRVNQMVEKCVCVRAVCASELNFISMNSFNFAGLYAID